MTGRGQRPVIGTSLLALLVVVGGAKIATVLPITESGRQAWSQIGVAMAQEADGDGAGGEAGDAAAADGTPRAVTDAPEAEAPEPLMEAIATERALLEDQKRAVADERAEVALARDALDTRIAQLEELKATVEALLEKAESAHEADIEQLTNLYAAMEPDDAARILADANPEVIIRVITEMKERDAAEIMAELPSDRSHAISDILLERSKLPGDRKPVQIRLD